ncbi:MAG: copper chaperone PCu(A)C [Candidatus Thiodiazotropha sp.]
MKEILLGLSLSAFSTTSAANGATEDITVSGLMVLATTEGQINSAAYMQLENDCRCEDHALVAVYSPVAIAVELHTQVNTNGIMKMRRIDEIELTANSKVVLQPGGLHLMLIGLKKVINNGDSVPLTLEFDDGSRMDVIAPARDIVVSDS